MRVFIHGSCVSRDLLSLVQGDGFELAFYSPRQSLIGLLGAVPRIERTVDMSNLASRFQRRAAEGTLRADVLKRLEHHHEETDMVLWDITDERLGVYELNGGYVTRTLELMNAGLDVHLRREARHIPFGTDEHFELWSRGLDRWRRMLIRFGLADRLVLLAPPWASYLNDGSPSPPSFGTHAIEHSFFAERYYTLARSAFPNLHALGRDIETRTSRDHQWGPAPFHYDDATSNALARALHRLVYEDVAAFPPPRPVIAAVGPRTVEVTARKTWAESLALHARKDEEVAVRSRYQEGELFRLHLPRPGDYVFRVFHRAGGQTVGVSSPSVSVP
jgi:hypothetical protein